MSLPCLTTFLSVHYCNILSYCESNLMRPMDVTYDVRQITVDENTFLKEICLPQKCVGEFFDHVRK